MHKKVQTGLMASKNANNTLSMRSATLSLIGSNLAFTLMKKSLILLIVELGEKSTHGMRIEYLLRTLSSLHSRFLPSRNGLLTFRRLISVVSQSSSSLGKYF